MAVEATVSSSTISSSNADRPPFWLEFSLFNDGQDVETAKALAAHRRKALNKEALGDRFHLFPKLPTEVRLQIWELLLAPRIVQVACFEASTAEERRREIFDPEPPSYSRSLSVSYANPPSTGTNGDGENDGGGDEVRSGGGRRRKKKVLSPGERGEGVPVPVILHINRESRGVGLKHYELAFSWKIPYVLAGSVIPVASQAAPIQHSGQATPGESQQRGGGEGGGVPPSPQQLEEQQKQEKRRQRILNWSQPRIYFSFGVDAMYLRGELEPCDSFGFNSPMSYFMKKEDTTRCDCVIISFAALGYGENSPPQIFGTIFHVADRFTNPRGGKILLAVTSKDEVTNAMVGNVEPLVGGVHHQKGNDESIGGDGEEGEKEGCGVVVANEDNLVQKIWSDGYGLSGSSRAPPLSRIKFVCVNEKELDRHVGGG